MYWPTLRGSVPLEELGWVNTAYLATDHRCDPSIVWGTTIDTEPLEAFLAVQRRRTGMLVSPAHVLVRAVAESLRRHPALNRRVIGRRVCRYDGVNITIPMLETRSGEVNIVFLRHAERMSLDEIARFLWEKARAVAVRAVVEERRRREGWSFGKTCRSLARYAYLHWVHRMARIGFWLTNRLRLPTTILHEVNGTSAFVNYLGFPGAPPMIAYKPSNLPTNSFSVSVTMGPSEPRPVVVDNALAIRRQASLFVRVDHRMVNGHQAAEFVSTLRLHLSNPWTLVQQDEPELSRAA